MRNPTRGGKVRTRLPPVTWFLGAILMAGSTGGIAEGLARNAAVEDVTPEMIVPMSRTATPAASLPSRPRTEAVRHISAYRAPAQQGYAPSHCARNSQSLCFDYRAGHVVYKPMRTLLPAIPGMTPHNLSFRRNRIVAEYSFK